MFKVDQITPSPLFEKKMSKENGRDILKLHTLSEINQFLIDMWGYWLNFFFY